MAVESNGLETSLQQTSEQSVAPRLADEINQLGKVIDSGLYKAITPTNFPTIHSVDPEYLRRQAEGLIIRLIGRVKDSIPPERRMGGLPGEDPEYTDEGKLLEARLTELKDALAAHREEFDISPS